MMPAGRVGAPISPMEENLPLRHVPDNGKPNAIVLVSGATVLLAYCSR